MNRRCGIRRQLPIVVACMLSAPAWAAVATFDADMEGWTNSELSVYETGPDNTVVWAEAGEGPGGVLVSMDIDDDWCYVVAPPKFHGAWHAGGTLADVLQDVTDFRVRCDFNSHTTPGTDASGFDNITAPVLPSADVNADGCVNVADLLIVRNNLGKSGSEITPPRSDANADGIVNVADLLIVRNNLGTGPGCP